MQKSNYNILLVDGDTPLTDLLKYVMEKEGFKVCIAATGKTALEIAKKEIPDLIILEVSLPITDGIELCVELRNASFLKRTFIVFYTIRNESYSEIAAFNAGADDYIIKPVKPEILIKRIKAILKRTMEEKQQRETSDSRITIDREKYVVIKDNKEIYFPRKEFELLELLFSVPRKIFTRKEIAQVLWNENALKSRTIDVHIRKLRKKLGEDFIKTLKGVGYSVEA